MLTSLKVIDHINTDTKIIDEISLDYYEEINSSITNLLDYYNNQMSTWIDDSEINKFNKLDNLNPYYVDTELYKVVLKSLKISFAFIIK